MPARTNLALLGGANSDTPTVQVPYMFAYAGAPWHTQQLVSQLTRQWYHPTAAGLPGNDDAGAMSSWYVFAVLGFYPVCLGGGSGGPKYIIVTQQFPEMTLSLAGGRTLIVKALNVSAVNVYIQSSELNGVQFSRSWITHAQVVAGGELRFMMGSEPNFSWGSATGDIPTEC